MRASEKMLQWRFSAQPPPPQHVLPALPPPGGRQPHAACVSPVHRCSPCSELPDTQRPTPPHAQVPSAFRCTALVRLAQATTPTPACTTGQYGRPGKRGQAGWVCGLPAPMVQPCLAGECTDRWIPRAQVQPAAQPVCRVFRPWLAGRLELRGPLDLPCRHVVNNEDVVVKSAKVGGPLYRPGAVLCTSHRVLLCAPRPRWRSLARAPEHLGPGSCPGAQRRTCSLRLSRSSLRCTSGRATAC